MVKCADCGFLAIRDIETRRLEETEQEIRLKGQLAPAPNTGKPIHKYEHPICFMQSKEYKAFPYTSRSILTLDRQDIRSEIQRERNCKDFTAWQQGFTPKEHRDMLDRQWQSEQEERRRKLDRIWHFIELGITLIVGAIIALIAANSGEG